MCVRVTLHKAFTSIGPGTTNTRVESPEGAFSAVARLRVTFCRRAMRERRRAFESLVLAPPENAARYRTLPAVSLESVECRSHFLGTHVGDAGRCKNIDAVHPSPFAAVIVQGDLQALVELVDGPCIPTITQGGLHGVLNETTGRQVRDRNRNLARQPGESIDAGPNIIRRVTTAGQRTHRVDGAKVTVDERAQDTFFHSSRLVEEPRHLVASLYSASKLEFHGLWGGSYVTRDRQDFGSGGGNPYCAAARASTAASETGALVRGYDGAIETVEGPLRDGFDRIAPILAQPPAKSSVQQLEKR